MVAYAEIVGERTVDRYDVLIVGTGHAGAQAAVSLRQFGYAGSIALIGEEGHLPYERPPLSKDYLAGGRSSETLLLRKPGYWSEKGIAVLLDRRIDGVDAASHTVVTGGGDTLGYGTLVWCAGGSARRLSCDGGDLAGVHTIRTRADVDLMRSELPAVKRVAVVGGGYIGLEAAAVLSSMGKAVTVIEVQDRVLARVAGEPLSRFYEAEHRAHGVDLRLDATVAAFEDFAGRAVGVRFQDGSRLATDMVIVGVGIVPSVQPLVAAGAEGRSGVSVDGLCQTSLPDVYAIGDCAAHRNRFGPDGEIRVESVQNAVDQAMVVARAIVGDPSPYDAVPWFWSNQYDLKLQTVGLSMGYDRIVVRGDPGPRGFSLVYLRDRRVVALDCVNAVRDYVQGRALVAGRMVVDPELLGDADRPLKSIVSGPA